MTNISNDSSDCLVPPLTTALAVNYIQACIALLLGTTGFLTNLFILVLIASYKKLRQRLMYLGLHIVVIDLVYTTTVPPAIFASGASGEWLFGEVMCNIFGIINDFFALFRFTMTLVLAVDRFISVFWPFFYEQHSLYLIVALVVGAYIVSIVRAFLALSGIFSCFQYLPTIKTCTAFSRCSDECFWLVAISVLIVIVFGVVIPLILYIMLFCKTRAIKRSLGSIGRTVVMSGIMSSSTAMAIQSDHSEMGVLGVSGGEMVKEAFGSKPLKEPGSIIGMELSSPHPGSKDDDDDDDADDVVTSTAEGNSGTSYPEKTLSGSSIVLKIGSDSESDSSNKNDEDGTGSVVAHSADVSNLNTVSSELNKGSIHEKDTDVQHTTILKHKVALEAEPEFGMEPIERTPRRTSNESSDNMERALRRLNSNTRMNITMFILLMSVIGCTTPAFLLYGVQFLLPKPNSAILIVNMMIGRTCFNLLPIVDSIAIMRHREFKVSIGRFIRSVKWKIRCHNL